MERDIRSNESAVFRQGIVDSRGQTVTTSCFLKSLSGDRLFVQSERRPVVPSKVVVQHRNTLYYGAALRSFPTWKGWRSEILVEQTAVASQSLLNLAQSLRSADTERSHLPALANALGAAVKPQGLIENSHQDRLGQFSRSGP